MATSGAFVWKTGQLEIISIKVVIITHKSSTNTHITMIRLPRNYGFVF